MNRAVIKLTFIVLVTAAVVVYAVAIVIRSSDDQASPLGTSPDYRDEVSVSPPRLDLIETDALLDWSEHIDTNIGIRFLYPKNWKIATTSSGTINLIDPSRRVELPEIESRIHQCCIEIWPSYLSSTRSDYEKLFRQGLAVEFHETVFPKKVEVFVLGIHGAPAWNEVLITDPMSSNFVTLTIPRIFKITENDPSWKILAAIVRSLEFISQKSVE
jgi:hypothetical protein